MDHLALISGQIPLVFYSAVLFYLILGAVLPFARLRRAFHGYFDGTAPTGQSHLLALDGFRGAATIAVFILHTWQWLKPYNDKIFDLFVMFSPGLQKNPNSKMGGKPVAVFMILSGFLIYRSLRGKIKSTQDIRGYFIRRFFRIYPLYLASVVATALCGFILAQPSVIQGFFSEAFMLRIFGRPIFANPVAWSLYVEVLVYLLMPIWVIMTEKGPLKAAILAFFILCLCGNEFFLPGNRELSLYKYFVVGIIACDIYDSSWYQNSGQWAAWATIFTGATLLWLDLSNLDPFILILNYSLKWTGFQFGAGVSDFTVVLAIGSAAFILGVLRVKPLTAFFSWFPFRFVGIISYSMYMWHGFLLIANTPVNFDGKGSITWTMNWPSQNGLGTLFLIYLPAMILVSAISYLLIERPFRNMSKKFT